MNTRSHTATEAIRNANRATRTQEARAAAAAQATHRIAWSTETEAIDGMLVAHGGYAVSDCATGQAAGFVRSSEWATTAESCADLRAGGYEPLGFGLVRRISGETPAA